jgi:thiamine biosynthesis lipoprotein
VTAVPSLRLPAGTRDAPAPPLRAASTFRALGTACRVVVESPSSGPDPGAAVAAVRDLVAEAQRRLTRFAPDSDLMLLNRAREETVVVDPLVLDALGAAQAAAARTEGLLDPTVLPALVAEGYAESRCDARPAGLLAALRDAPTRRPAAPAHDGRWRSVRLGRRERTVTRPVGVQLDVGATAKGWLADRAAALLHPFARWAVDLGGDLRVGGPGARTRPFAVDVAGPLGGPVGRVLLSGGAIATSGIDRRIWRRPDGRPAHHLIDPSSGRSAWTGLLTVTALAPTAEEAEILAGATLLRGPAAVDALAPRGGLAVDEHGVVLRHATDRAGAWRWSA